MSSSAKNLIYLFILSLIVLLPYLNRETGYDIKGEYRWTLPTVVETFNSKDWMIPKLDGLPRFRKPPVIYWLMTGSCKIFGLTLFWARFPITVTASLAVLLFYIFLGTFGLGRDKRFTGALILLGCWGYYVYSRVAALEIPMLFFTLAAFWGASRLFLHEKPDGIIIAAAAAGFTLMTKSHATLISLTIFALSWMAIHKRWYLFKKFKWYWISAAVLFLLIVLPWYLYVSTAYKEIFLSTMKKELIEDRLKHHHAHFFRMAAGIFTLILPYTLIFGASLWQSIKERSMSALFLAMAIVSCIFPYIFVNSHRLRYMVPLLPFCSALIPIHYNSSVPLFKWTMRITGLLILLPGLVIIRWLMGLSIINTCLVIIWTAVLLAVSWSYYTGRLKYAALSTTFLTLLFIGIFYSSVGIGAVGNDIVEKLSAVPYATFDREPYYLSVKLKKPPVIDIQDVDDFKHAAGMNAVIYVPGKEFDRLNRYMGEAGYTDYSVYMKTRRFREYPPDSLMKRALRKMDLDEMKEDTLLIKDLR